GHLPPPTVRSPPGGGRGGGGGLSGQRVHSLPRTLYCCLSLCPVAEIKSRSGVTPYPSSDSQRGVEAATTTTAAAAAAATVGLRSVRCQRSAQGSGGCGRACAHGLLLRNKDRRVQPTGQRAKATAWFGLGG
ncbi:hypothetical protein INR49_019781, partial [Caranx melampygus]